MHFSAFVFGAIVSTTVLNPKNENSSVIDEERLAFCGAKDCPDNPYSDDDYVPPESTVGNVFNNDIKMFMLCTKWLKVISFYH